MNEVVKKETQEPAAVEPVGFKVGQWVGRREAFGLIAGRCSAAEIETVRQIRDQKLYEDLNCTWEECCLRHLHASRRSVDRELGYLRKYGPAFFTVRQLTHISVREYQSIAAHITEEGVNLDGTVLALHSDNSHQLSAAVDELLKRVEPERAEQVPEAEPFDALLKRCQTAAEKLQAFDGSLDAEQRLRLSKAVADVRAAAAGLGAVVWDRR